MNTEEREVYAQDLALARYAVIAPLICRRLERTEFSAELERVVSVKHKFPDGPRSISRRSVRRWCHYYRKGRKLTNKVVVPPGLDALRPHPRADLGQPRVLDEEVIDRAVALRKELPSRKTGRLVDLLKAEAESRGEEPPGVKESTLNYHLRSRNATRRKLRGQSRAFRRFEHPHRNSCWQGDWADGIWLPHPQNPKKTRKCYLHAFIDDHTRYIAHAEFYFRQNLPCLEDCFRKAVLKGGIPEMTYVDNGPAYQARQFKLMAARLGTNLVFATEYSPEGKGKVERWIQTLKDDFLDEARHADIPSLAELNAFFWAWLDGVYHSRQHSQTGASPRERWEAGTDRMCCVDPADLVDIFLWKEKRTVDKAGCFKLGGNLYPVAEHLVRQDIEVRFDPFDLETVRVYHRGVFIEMATPQELVRRTYRKAEPRRGRPPAAIESSLLYRKQLSEGYRQQVQSTIEQVGEADDRGYLTEAEWTRLLMVGLERPELRAHERTLVFQFFQRYAPLPEPVVKKALNRVVDEKGVRLHLRVYLRRIQEAVAAARGGG